MDLARVRPRRARWAVPAGLVAAVGIVIGGSAIGGGAQAAPRLPARSTAQLLAAVDGPAPPPMTGVVRQTASLGLPDLPGSSDPLSPLSLLSGSHTFDVWYDGPTRVRVAVPVSLGETDLRRDGRDVWLWDSKTNQATHYVLPAAAETPAQGTQTGVPAPQALAQQALAAVGPTTTVGLQQNVTVAGQAAYQLSLAPKDSRSLVGQVRIAIDARDSAPLRVQVFARGAASPAVDVGFTSLSFGVPAASNFTFAPPPGAKLKTVTVPAGSGGSRPGAPAPPRFVGKGWLSVAVLPSVPADESGGIVGALQSAATPVQGSWGSGRLLRTSLLSVLITSGGQILAGAVQPSVLYADAAQLT